ncbi:hypothetical protein PR202_gb29891 [Eleusine coracana subsp. coracana]|uniref:Uncharacterized protein n=1 Tax=Eleusine coracana subsp. coracana TaxID=191504 RepID=A0AAV5FY83_ELECO|nr:hypothetical protein PR202_gb29891 [Eleusine coracana subsp. coracana]
MAALAKPQPQQSVVQSFPFRAAVLALCVALLPLLPTQAPEGLVGANGVGRAFLAKAWELLHLLLVGIAVSYGLFSRKNTSADAHPDEKQEDSSKPADARYVSRMFRDSLAPFIDDDDYEVIPGGGGGGGREDEGGKARSWSAVHRPDEPVVVVTSNGSRGSAETLSLPVRTLKPQPGSESPLRRGGPPRDSAARGPEETVLPSPIPWRSRSGRFYAARPASSSSRETLAKATEEYYSKRIRSPRRSTPPAPPPPPPPFLVHGYHPPAAERRHAAKSFKEELQDHSVRSRGQEGDRHFSLNKSGSFNASAYSYYNTTDTSSPAKPRSSFDSSSSSASVGKSVRTFRAREPPVFPDQQIQDVPEDLGDVCDAQEGSEEPYGSYRAYQSIPRFQYERSVSDPILGGVAVSSDDTESSDDDDEEGRYSTPEVDENEVDKKAEEFIARFREQIRRQRIESIKRSAGPRGVKHGK